MKRKAVRIPRVVIPKEVVAFRKQLRSIDEVGLGNYFLLTQFMAEAMATRHRWDSRARPHLQPTSRARGRQIRRENDLQHCFNTAFLAGVMVEIERRAGNRDFDPGLFILAGAFHDVPELFRGDNPYWLKTSRHEKAEQRGFEVIVRRFSPQLRKFLRDAYRITQPDQSRPASRWTREQRFFKLIELVGYLDRALAECRRGNLNFAPVLQYHVLETSFPHNPFAFEKEFPATIRFWFPTKVKEEMEKFARTVTSCS